MPVVPDAPREIVETDTLTPERRQHLFYFEHDVFCLASFNLQWEPKVRFFHVFESGELIANAGVVARTVDVAGTPVRVAGIGGVVCRPEARGRGHATAAVLAALAHATTVMAAEFGMLFCLPRLVPFYGRTGWERLAAAVWFEQPAGTVRSPLEVMVKPLSGRRWPEGEVRVNGRPW